MDQWELDMGFLENLTNDAFANKMADHYHTHIGAAEFKSIKAEAKRADSPRTPLWGAQPFLNRGMQGGINALTAPIVDAVRVGGFMASPKGLLFIAKQTGLQRSNPLGEFGGNPIHISRKYNSLSTIDQILRGPLGTHIDRHGGGTTNLEETNYEPRIKKLNQGKSNRLVDIASQLDLGYHREFDITSSEIFRFDPKASLEQKKQSRNSNSNKGRPEGTIVINAMSGLGGPNSFFGIGRTEHKAYLRNLPNHIATYYKPSRNTLPVGDPGPDSYTGIKGTEGDYKGLGESKDYLFDPTTDKDYPNKYRPSERPLPVGDPGPHSYKGLKGTEGDFKKIAESNDFSPINIPAKSGDDAIIKYGALDYGGITRKGKTNDSLKAIRSFRNGTEYEATDNSYARIGLIDYGKSTGGQADSYGETAGSENDYVTLKLKRGSDEIKFRSYGLGSITDNTSFSWSEVKYAGRTMAQQRFDSVARDVSHDLMIVSFTAVEAKQNYIRLNKLYQMASPSINGTGLATAAFCQLTLGDLYKNQNVIIDKITFTVDEDVPWDINLGTPGTETAKAELPMVIKLNLGYKLLTNADGGFFTKGTRYWKTAFDESVK